MTRFLFVILPLIFTLFSAHSTYASPTRSFSSRFCLNILSACCGEIACLGDRSTQPHDPEPSFERKGHYPDSSYKTSKSILRKQRSIEDEEAGLLEHDVMMMDDSPRLRDQRAFLNNILSLYENDVTLLLLSESLSCNVRAIHTVLDHGSLIGVDHSLLEALFIRAVIGGCSILVAHLRHISLAFHGHDLCRVRDPFTNYSMVAIAALFKHDHLAKMLLPCYNQDGFNSDLPLLQSVRGNSSLSLSEKHLVIQKICPKMAVSKMKSSWILCFYYCLLNRIYTDSILDGAVHAKSAEMVYQHSIHFRSPRLLAKLGCSNNSSFSPSLRKILVYHAGLKVEVQHLMACMVNVKNMEPEIFLFYLDQSFEKEQLYLSYSSLISRALTVSLQPNLFLRLLKKIPDKEAFKALIVYAAVKKRSDIYDFALKNYRFYPEHLFTDRELIALSNLGNDE